MAVAQIEQSYSLRFLDSEGEACVEAAIADGANYNCPGDSVTYQPGEQTEPMDGGDLALVIGAVIVLLAVIAALRFARDLTTAGLGRLWNSVRSGRK
jgi:hypothetical protein